jgi:glycosyltransferase involved in cell wall biosynthesis
MEIHVRDLSLALRAKDDFVEVICAPGSRLENDLSKNDFITHAIDAGGYFRPITIIRAGKLFRKIQPDILHVHYSKDLWWVIPGLRFCQRIPVLLSKHIGTQKPKRDLLHRYLYARLQCIIAISNVIRNNVIDTHPIAPQRVVVVHHGVDLSKFNVQQIDKKAQRRELGYSENQTVIGIIGRLQASKGYFEFLDMAAILRKKYPETRFLVVGEASHGEEKQAQEIFEHIDRLELNDVVNCCGYREDIPQVLSAMDIFVFPSHAEAFGLVLIEAMAMAKPVVSSNCDGVLDIVVDGETGFLVPPKNVAELSRTTEKLLGNKKMRNRMAKKARARIEQYFNNEKVIQKIREIYRQAVNEIYQVF